MKVSIVTVSFNQVDYLSECIESVLKQDYEDLEYIVVDAGSTDGSRELIKSYGQKIIAVFELDDGPADGLNKGFSRAAGDILGFLNSDDYLLPNAISEVVNYFKKSKATDVLSGHSLIVDEQSNTLRRFYSDRMGLIRYAYQGVILSQPSTFFRSCVFKKTNGFNVNNRSNWDGELFSDFAILGFKFSVVNKIFSAYRLQKDSITATGRLRDAHERHLESSFEKIMNRRMTKFDAVLCVCVRLIRKVTNPRDTLQRVMYGPIFQNGKM